MNKLKRPRVSNLKSDIKFQTARSSGPGGQHANKVETKVILILDVLGSKNLSDFQKQQISEKLETKINKNGEIIVSSESTRSQVRNKELAFKKLDRLLSRAFKVNKKRKKSKPSRSAIEKRIKEKKINSEKKALRKKPKGFNY